MRYVVMVGAEPRESGDDLIEMAVLARELSERHSGTHVKLTHPDTTLTITWYRNGVEQGNG